MEDWAIELFELERLCENGHASDGADAVRRFYQLAVNAPPPANAVFAGSLSPERLEALLACDAPFQAVVTMIKGRIGYLLTENAKGVGSATVVIDGIVGEQSSVARDPLLALVAALSRALQHGFAGSRVDTPIH